ncbi:MAG: hypothetical protein P1U37_15810 [Minwuia sp.]|nr:hypothetical protein [Minwuia sp.]
MAFIRHIGLLAGLAALLAVPVSEAAQFRQARPIARPAPVPDGFQPAMQPIRIPQPMVERAVREVFANWNSPGFDRYLSPSLFDRDRLIDNIAEFAPPDAELRLLGLQSVRQLGQVEQRQPDGSRLIIAKISATALTAVEFEDSATGFQRLEGLQEYLFSMTVRAR